VKNIT